MLKIFTEDRPVLTEIEINKLYPMSGYIMLNPEPQFSKTGVQLPCKGELCAVAQKPTEEEEKQFYKEANRLTNSGEYILLNTINLDDEGNTL